MKILRIVSMGYEAGGAENGILLLQPVLEKKGHIVKALASDRRPDAPHFNEYTFKSIGSSFVEKYIYTAFNPHSFFALKKVLKDYNPDIIHLHTMGQVSPSVLFLLKKHPTVLTVHGPEAFTKSLLLWYLPISDFKNGEYIMKDLRISGKLRHVYHRCFMGLLYYFGLRNVDVVVTMSKYMQQLMANEGLQTTYIPNCTTLLSYKPLKKEEITNTLLYVGRLEKFKGVDYLIHAMPLILEKFSDAHLYIAGEGPVKTELEKLVKAIGIQRNVTFLGHLNREELEKIYQRSVIVVMPSTWPEAFGKIGIEAMSVGRVVIASNLGGISEWLVDGEVGHLVPPEDSKSIADKVIALLGDRDLLQAMSAKARKQAENYSIEGHANKITKLYENIINKRKHS